MEQIWFVNAACSAGCSPTFSKKQKVSPAKDNTLQKESSSQELLYASCYFVTDSLLLNGLEARGSTFLCCYDNGLSQNVQRLRLGPENVLQQPSGGMSHVRLEEDI